MKDLFLPHRVIILFSERISKSRLDITQTEMERSLCNMIHRLMCCNFYS